MCLFVCVCLCVCLQVGLDSWQPYGQFHTFFLATFSEIICHCLLRYAGPAVLIYSFCSIWRLPSSNQLWKLNRICINQDKNLQPTNLLASALKHNSKLACCIILSALYINSKVCWNFINCCGYLLRKLFQTFFPFKMIIN